MRRITSLIIFPPQHVNSLVLRFVCFKARFPSGNRYFQTPCFWFSNAARFYSMLQKGPRPMVLCGPSGSGKSTLIKRLFEEFPDMFGYSVSHTTRAPRLGEENGKHYYFINKEEMQKQIENGEFLENATFSGNLYGTSKHAVEDVQKAGKVCVLDIEMQGVKQVKESSLNPLYIFIKPPSISELEQRLRNRKTESEESLQCRLAIAATEIEYGEESGNFDIVIKNDKLDKAYENLREFIFAEINKPIKIGI